MPLRSSDSEKDARFNRGVGDLFGFAPLVDAIWSNRTARWYCLACREKAPAPIVELGAEPDSVCAGCGRAVGEGQS